MDQGAHCAPWVLAFHPHHFFLVLLEGLCVLLILGHHLHLGVLGYQQDHVHPLDPEDQYDLDIL